MVGGRGGAVRLFLVGALLLGGSACAATSGRFFVMGDGTLALVNAHTDERVDVRYRRSDGSYDDEAIARIRRAFRSTGDDGDGKASLRLIEVLSWAQRQAKVRPLTLLSGYRSPQYNEDLRTQGVRAAGGSLHTEGLAADVAFPGPALKPLWLQIRRLECCGAGYYAKEGFLHIDVGKPRFWEPSTSRVEENLSAGNARLFARTDFDRYGAGETIAIALHALTVPPVLVSRAARLVSDDGSAAALDLEGVPAARDGCLDVAVSGAEVRAKAAASPARGRIVLETCTPRSERTPATFETNLVEIR
jgi:uncharacterized protein YcbK (DUF882 family)